MKKYYVAYEGSKQNPTAILLCYKTSPLGSAEWVCRKEVAGLNHYNSLIAEWNKNAEWLQTQHNNRNPLN